MSEIEALDFCQTKSVVALLQNPHNNTKSIDRATVSQLVSRVSLRRFTCHAQKSSCNNDSYPLGAIGSICSIIQSAQDIQSSLIPQARPKSTKKLHERHQATAKSIQYAATNQSKHFLQAAKSVKKPRGLKCISSTDVYCPHDKIMAFETELRAADRQYQQDNPLKHTRPAKTQHSIMPAKNHIPAILMTLITASAIQNTEVKAEVDSKIHKLCIEAKDYVGCVRAMKGDTNGVTRQIRSQGADIAEGNQCPSGFAYIGGGNCMEVKCKYGKEKGFGHDQRVAGKADWGCKHRFMYGAGNMVLVGNARTSINPKCPPGEPEIGYNSTCQKPPAGWESPSEKAAREKREGPKCDYRLMAYQCSYSAYLDANPAIKQWAELNPEMAAKEKARLEAID